MTSEGVTVPDAVSLGELAWRQARSEEAWKSEVSRLEREHRTDIDRLERDHLAAMQRLERDHAEDLRKLREDVIKPMGDRLTTAEKRPGMSTTRWLAAVTVVLMFLAFVMQTYGTLKGAK